MYLLVHLYLFSSWLVWSTSLVNFQTHNAIKSFVSLLVRWFVRWSVMIESNCENANLWSCSYDCLWVLVSMVWGRVWMGVVRPCLAPPPSIQTPNLRHSLTITDWMSWNIVKKKLKWDGESSSSQMRWSYEDSKKFDKVAILTCWWVQRYGAVLWRSPWLATRLFDFDAP